MIPDADISPHGAPQNPRFITTHWSVVMAAGGKESPAVHEALQRLCQIYWYPIYAYVRRRGYAPEDAEDLTQGFFARLLKRNDFADVRRERGKFRTFLLVAVNNYMSEQRRRDAAAKRGGDDEIISLDAPSAEQRYQLEPHDTTTPEKLYDRRWAFTLLEKARSALAEEYRANGKADLYHQLINLEPGAKNLVSLAEIGHRLGKTEGAIKSDVSRLRKRYRELVREEIAQTVASVLDIDDEVRYLFEVVG